MARKNIKKKRVIFIITIIIIFIIIFGIYLNIMKKNAADKEREKFQEFSKEYESQTILPRKIYELYNYDGSLERDYLYKHMKIFLDYMSYLKENINEDNLKDFYQNNSEDIKEKLGIINKEEFEKFLESIKDKDVSSNKFKYAEIEVGTSYTEKKYFYFNIFFYYEGQEEPLNIQVGLSTISSADILIKYKIL